jgi:hypothetical protein
MLGLPAERLRESIAPFSRKSTKLCSAQAASAATPATAEPTSGPSQGGRPWNVALFFCVVITLVAHANIALAQRVKDETKPNLVSGFKNILVPGSPHKEQLLVPWRIVLRKDSRSIHLEQIRAFIMRVVCSDDRFIYVCPRCAQVSVSAIMARTRATKTTNIAPFRTNLR